MTAKSEVGYGKPPREHQFKPGQSGNPRGRPKGARGFKADVEQALSAKVVVTEDGIKRRITVVAAALLRLIQNAVKKGDLRAFEMLLTLARQQDAGAPQSTPVLSPNDEALLADFVRRNNAENAND
jgi:hypothetical protein